jgi:polysaccharide biosynthesis transport protein
MDEALVRQVEQGTTSVSGRYPPDTTPTRWPLLPILRRHSLLIASCPLVLGGATAYFTARATPQYEASASVRIEDPEAEPRLEHLPISTSPTPTELPTELEVLGSRALAEAIVDSLGLQVQLQAPVGLARRRVFSLVRTSREAPPTEYRLERQPDGQFRVRDRESGVVLGQMAPGARGQMAGLELRLDSEVARYHVIDFRVSSFDRTVQDLQRALEIRRRKREANIMDVTYRGSDPEFVRDVPNALANRFIAGVQAEHHAKARSTAKLLREQIKRLSTNLEGAEDRLRAFRERNGVVSLTDEASSGVARASELQAKRNAVEAERVALSNLAQSLEDSTRTDSTSSVLAYRNLLAFPTLLHDEAMAGLLRSMVALEDRRNELLARRTLQDPDVQNLTDRLYQLGNQVRTMALTYLRGLENQVDAFDAALAQSREQLDRIPEKELRFARLQRESNGLEEIVAQLQSQLKQAEVAEAVEDPSVRLVDAAVLPTAPVSPKPVLNIALALALGVMLGTSGALLQERMDRSVRSRHDVLIATGVPVLGLVPHARARGWLSTGLSLRARRARRTKKGDRIVGSDVKPRARVSAGLVRTDSTLSLVEAYNLLDTNLAFVMRGESARVLMVTSPLPGEGKTTVAVNLAITLARRGTRVLLMDGDLRRGTIATVFGTRQDPGLSDILLGTVRLGDAARAVPVSETQCVHVLGCGRPYENPIELLGSTQFSALLASLRERYDSIIVDTPPANVVADPSMVAAHSDGVIVVARAAVTQLEALAFAVEQLAHVRAPVIGTVLNDIDFRRDALYDEAYRYYARSDDYAVRAGRAGEV